MNAKELEIFEQHAEVCKALSSPKRLLILNILQERELTAGEIVSATCSLKSNISQHLVFLKRLGILKSRRVGKNVFYKISDIRIIQACTLMRDFLNGRLENGQKLLAFSERGDSKWK